VCVCCVCCLCCVCICWICYKIINLIFSRYYLQDKKPNYDVDKRNELIDLIFYRNGIIFGGFVRDFVRELYLNETCEAKDIDVYFSDSQYYNNFRNDLQKNQFFMICSEGKDIANYVKHLQIRKNTIKWYNVQIMTKDFEIHLDIMVLIDQNMRQEVFPPFSTPDFYCNSLMIDGNNIRLSPSIVDINTSFIDNLKLFEEIKHQILNKEAIEIENTKIHRLEKMHCKKWNITIKLKLFKIINKGFDDDICILCQKELKKKEIRIQPICDCKSNHYYCCNCLENLLKFQTNKYDLNGIMKCLLCQKIIDSEIFKSDLNKLIFYYSVDNKNIITIKE